MEDILYLSAKLPRVEFHECNENHDIQNMGQMMKRTVNRNQKKTWA